MNAHIHPSGPLRGTVDPPSSKNYTTRFLLASSLAQGESRLLKPAISDDAMAMVECLRGLGAHLQAFDRNNAPISFSLKNAEAIESVRVRGFGGRPSPARPDSIPAPEAGREAVELNPHNAGAVLRLLIGVGALLPGVRFVTDHPESLGKRPNRDLLDALAQVGVEWESPTPEGTLPIVLRGGKDRIDAALDRLAAQHSPNPPRIEVSGAVSSQFVSAVLFLAPLLGREIEVVVTCGLRSKPLVETTLEVLRESGVRVDSTPDLLRHRVHAGSGYRERQWMVHGDWPGAAALLAAAAVAPDSRVTVQRLYDDLQGERLVLDLLRRMGCRVERVGPVGSAPPSAVLAPPAAGSSLESMVIDGDQCTDAVLALYAAAALARGETRIFGIRNLQFKECDRIRDPLEELRKIYATLPAFQTGGGQPDRDALHRAIRWLPEDDPDEVRIQGCPDGFEGGIAVDGRGDHRVIMMLSIVGLRCRRGLVIRGAQHVAKSYPRWFEDLKLLGARVELSEADSL